MHIGIVYLIYIISITFQFCIVFKQPNEENPLLHTFQGEAGWFELGSLWRTRLLEWLSISTPASLHLTLHNKLSSDKNLQFLQVWAALRRSRGSRNDKTYSANCNTSSNLIRFIQITVIKLFYIARIEIIYLYLNFPF